ncbi:hypothetical protein QI633_09635 [Nocardioides sp. QY071]|uniref:hypothetical protein n=1 Tax=Nocardioides sp. QY071 TaxID=3044187 RepID=UPI002499F1BD|nr:hypothetical protein [Nocardioides sp. QY071]WGY04014.1 hypothetical protein QI633_09635 [Nocardioides sp. QY071]
MDRKTKRISPGLGRTRKVVIPDDMYADLKQIAAMQSVPVAAVMRASYEHYINHVMKRKRGAA